MYEFWLITHFLGLALGVGASFAAVRLGRATKDLAPEERGAFMQRASALGKNASLGLALLIVSGFALWFYRGIREVLAFAGGAFHTKLTLVAIMIGLFGYLQVQAKKARVNRDPAAMARLPKLSIAMLVLGVLIVICAVIAFK